MTRFGVNKRFVRKTQSNLSAFKRYWGCPTSTQTIVRREGNLRNTWEKRYFCRVKCTRSGNGKREIYQGASAQMPVSVVLVGVVKHSLRKLNCLGWGNVSKKASTIESLRKTLAGELRKASIWWWTVVSRYKYVLRNATRAVGLNMPCRVLCVREMWKILIAITSFPQIAFPDFHFFRLFSSQSFIFISIQTLVPSHIDNHMLHCIPILHFSYFLFFNIVQFLLNFTFFPSASTPNHNHRPFALPTPILELEQPIQRWYYYY